MAARKAGSGNRAMRSALRAHLEPGIEALGFSGKYPEWRRESGDEVHFILLQLAKYGGSFSLQAAWSKIGTDGQDLEKGFARTEFEQRAILTCPIELWTVEGARCDYQSKAFDYRFMLDDAEACERLAKQCADGLSALDDWLITRRFTPRAAPIGNTIGEFPNDTVLRAIARAKAELGLY
uniref:DUF4304 domain-containing protein n=1 Tax=Parerythrobacter lutipelagi TaxID=1964208 RepID=UPI0010F78CBF|nr:DUF4304 domain-containing protein [Parerythrobacter lutipelagi]